MRSAGEMWVRSVGGVRERLRCGARGMPGVTIAGSISVASGSPTRSESERVRSIGFSGWWWSRVFQRWCSI